MCLFLISVDSCEQYSLGLDKYCIEGRRLLLVKNSVNCMCEILRLQILFVTLQL